MPGRRVPGLAVAVRNHERILKRRSRFNRHADFRQDLAAEADEGNVADFRDGNIVWRGRAVFFNLKLAPRLARKFERDKRCLNVTAGGKRFDAAEYMDDFFTQQRSEQYRLGDPARLGIESVKH